MLGSHVRTAVRNLIRQRGYTAVNLIGLALGLVICQLVAAYLVHELTFENGHTRGDRIYRITTDLEHPRFGTGEFACAPPPLGPVLVEASSEVEAVARFRHFDDVRVSAGTTVRREPAAFAVEPEFFEVFDIEVLRGDPSKALAEPSTAFITESLAHALFGRADPINQTIELRDGIEVHVRGILADIPSNTKLNCGLLVSYSTPNLVGEDINDWSQIWYDYAYVLLRPGADPHDVAALFPAIMDQYLSEEQRGNYAYRLQPLHEIYFDPRPANELDPSGDITYMILFSAVAMIIMAIACINFANLTTARMSQRAKELNVRQVVGASRGQLVRQLLVESLLLTALASIVAIVAFEGLNPLLDHFLGRSIDVDIIPLPMMALIVAGLAVGVGLVAGLYPALQLSRMRLLKSIGNSLGPAPSKSYTRRVLVVFQFSVAIALTVLAAVIFRQMEYSRSWDKGMDTHHLAVVSLEGEHMIAQSGLLQNALQRTPGVTGVGRCDMLLGLSSERINFFTSPVDPELDRVIIREVRVDPGTLSLWGLNLVEGRLLTDADGGETNNRIVIDRRAASRLKMDRPVGMTITTDDEESYEIVGVLEEFHAMPTFRRDRPVMFRVREQGLRHVLVRVESPGVLAAIQQTWEGMFPDEPFECRFYDDMINDQYGDHDRLGALVGVFSLVAAVIACLGIMSLASYAAERRHREIGIRKVVGATVGSVVRLVGSEFLLLVLVANVVALPVAWYLAGIWLEEFPHSIRLGPGLFLSCGAAALIVALASVVFQALRAARSNPVEALRCE